MADDQKLEPGTVVQLKSGGPAMTVRLTAQDGTTVTCIWYNEKTADYTTDRFDTRTLRVGVANPL